MKRKVGNLKQVKCVFQSDPKISNVFKGLYAMPFIQIVLLGLITLWLVSAPSCNGARSLCLSSGPLY